jgi:hypothetical protein
VRGRQPVNCQPAAEVIHKVSTTLDSGVRRPAECQVVLAEMRWELSTSLSAADARGIDVVSEPLADHATTCRTSPFPLCLLMFDETCSPRQAADHDPLRPAFSRTQRQIRFSSLLGHDGRRTSFLGPSEVNNTALDDATRPFLATSAASPARRPRPRRRLAASRGGSSIL